jgi:hypothetical protein
MTSFRGIPRLGLGIPPRPKQAWGAILDLSNPHTILLISFRIKELLELWDVFLMQFVLIAHSFIFLICSNPGLANLSCTVKQSYRGTLLFICLNNF